MKVSEVSQEDEEIDLWQELWRLRWQAFGSGTVDRAAMDQLARRAAASEHHEVAKLARNLLNAGAKVNYNTRFEWLTSVVGGQRFPPVQIDVAGPEGWDGNGAASGKMMDKGDSWDGDLYARICSGIPHIQQHREIPDCSLVASLINVRQRAASALRVRHIGATYVVNLHFNGSDCRLVRVDLSYVPRDSQGSILALHSHKIEDVVLERAYLLVKNGGSYKLSGSNAAIDTYLLTGYIPEIRHVRNDAMKRITTLLKGGMCIIALGTAEKVNDRNLKSSHDYATIEIHSNGNLVVRDPLDASRKLEIDECTLLTNFKFMYFNWNPRLLFAHHQTLHFRYTTDPMNNFPTVIDKPLFEIFNKSEQSESVWVFLEQHFDRTLNDQSICLVQQVPDSVLLVSNRFDGSNSGFYLLKVEISSKNCIKLFCHSEVSANYSLHFYHISALISCKKATVRALVASVDDEWNSANYYGAFSNPEFYKNPTFELVVESNSKDHVYVDLQLLGMSTSLLNLQIYHMDDYDLTKPIVFDESYTEGIYIRKSLPIVPNARYKVICSSYHQSDTNRFKLLATTSSKNSKVKLSKCFPQYGSHKYQLARNFSWRKETNRVKIPFGLVATTFLHIRVLALEFQGEMFIRINIFDDDTQELLLHNEDFCILPRHGLVIPDFSGMGGRHLTLLIEKDGPPTMFNSVPMRLEIGSDFKVVLNG
ncbi:LAFE_0D00738g1_1 [Lachancea fermentati]|uniref:Cysteine protease RIM13 n=1 Tax=Lachancea fermentati TaxID=4955 RepID=A0A1G4MAN1_LACFM|nr:LAFE_0D00738g1_1 [Lachancea fermentati]